MQRKRDVADVAHRGQLMSTGPPGAATVRSAPAQNSPPAPVNTITRSSLLDAISRNVSSSSFHI